MTNKLKKKKLSSHRPYTLGEEIANAVSHGIGIGLALAGLLILTVLSTLTHDPWKVTSSIIYGITLLLGYSASTLYHAVPHPNAKRILKIIDHAGIYLLIAGTYTPFTLVALRHDWGWPIFITIWVLALAGIAAESFWTYRPKWISSLIYVFLGCFILIAIVPLKATLPTISFWLLVSGGIVYAAGSIVYAFQQIKYLHTVWHGFAIAGSVCFFLSILFLVIQ